MKRTQQLTADNLLAWKRTEAELRREFQSQEAALQKTLGKLRAELARVSDEARDNRDKCHKLQTSLTAAESNVKVSVRAVTSQLLSARSRSSFLPLGLSNQVTKGRCTNTLTTTSTPPLTSTYRLDVFAVDQ